MDRKDSSHERSEHGICVVTLGHHPSRKRSDSDGMVADAHGMDPGVDDLEWLTRRRDLDRRTHPPCASLGHRGTGGIRSLAALATEYPVALGAPANRADHRRVADAHKDCIGAGRGRWAMDCSAGLRPQPLAMGLDFGRYVCAGPRMDRRPPHRTTRLYNGYAADRLIGKRPRVELGLASSIRRSVDHQEFPPRQEKITRRTRCPLGHRFIGPGMDL